MQPAEFIASCERLQRLDRSAEVIQSVREGVEVAMPDHFAIPFSPDVTTTFRRGGRPSRHRRGQWHELVQHLKDLAYLTPKFFSSWHQRRAADQPPTARQIASLVKAVRAFWTEDPFWTTSLVPAMPTQDAARQQRWVEHHLTELVYRASSYTSFDGDLSPDVQYRIGDRSAFGRSLAFRMRVYFRDYQGGHTNSRKAYFDRKLLPLLYSLNNSLGGALAASLPGRDATVLDEGIQRVLLDATLLFATYRRANRFTARDRGSYYLLYQLEPRTGEVKDLVVPDAKEEQRRLLRLRRRTKRKLTNARLYIDTGGNRLGIRLMQLGLWRAGCYIGVLDGVFGLQSHRALLALVAQEREAVRPVLGPRQLDRVVNSVGEEVLVDLRLVGILLDAYAPPPQVEAQREEAHLWQAIDAAGVAETLDEQLLDREASLRPLYGHLEHHPHRRVYYGLRGLIRGAVRAITVVISWIRDRVRQLLGAVFDFVKAVVKRVQEAGSLFFTGFRYFSHYLLGRPFISLGAGVGEERPVVLTRFALDFDTVCFTDRTASVEDIRMHQRYVSDMQRGAAYFLRVTALLIRSLATLSAPQRWIRLGVLLAREVRRVLQEVASGRPLGRLEQVE
ncbi:hypothetical protein LEM8419_01306 [Neolewinella maritima]|uniref:Uncharacterized protein n=1 Tax=Neolewinella maritima TaxID=1383882 RepID=A0ABM9AZ77_9BACT|nr:hypothetical protein [Neolewinella maritima]CAH1000159.1 hypothetical protein LEM8419_01306 [Neolewinella maritima]